MASTTQSRLSSHAQVQGLRVRLETALVLRSTGRLQEALEMVSACDDLSPDLYSLRGDLQLELGQVQEAVGSYSTVLAFEAGNLYAQYHLALCLRRLKLWDAAAEAFRKVLAHESHYDNARIGLGDCLLTLNRVEEALACFDACWSEAARVPALFGKAVALQRLRRLNDAESVYQRLLALEPKSEEALSNLIALAMEPLDVVRVHRYSLRLLELSPKSPVALQGLIVAALQRGEHESAASYYSMLLQRLPGGAFPRNAPSENAIEYNLSFQMLERLNPFGADAEPLAGSNENERTSIGASAHPY